MDKKYTIKEIRRAFMLGHPVSSFASENKRREHWEKIKDALLGAKEQ